MKIRLSVDQYNVEQIIKDVMSKYHYQESDRPNLEIIYQKIMTFMEPYAVYRINRRVTGVKVIDDNQTAIVAMTLGKGIDRLQEKFENDGKLDEAYMIDCIANEILLHMYTEFNESYARFHRRYVQRYYFVGGEIPLCDMSSILKEINGQGNSGEPDDYGIYANPYGVLNPSKSVVFYAILSEDSRQVCEGICVGCSNQECEYKVEREAQKNQNLNYGFVRIFGR